MGRERKCQVSRLFTRSTTKIAEGKKRRGRGSYLPMLRSARKGGRREEVILNIYFLREKGEKKDKGGGSWGGVFARPRKRRGG